MRFAPRSDLTGRFASVLIAVKDGLSVHDQNSASPVPARRDSGNLDPVFQDDRTT